jgi:hypothetical protein
VEPEGSSAVASGEGISEDGEKDAEVEIVEAIMVGA